MHRARDLLVKQRTQLINMMRGLLAEFGIGISDGLGRALLMAQVVDGAALGVPAEAGRIVLTLSQQHPTNTVDHQIALAMREPSTEDVRGSCRFAAVDNRCPVR
jgi:transposase